MKRINRHHQCNIQKNRTRANYLQYDFWHHSVPELPFYPFCIEECVRKTPIWYSESFSRYMILVIVIEGSISYRFEDQEILLTPGKILIIPQNGSYYFENGPEGSYRKIVMEIMGKNLLSVADTLGMNHFSVISSAKCMEYVQWMRSVGRLLQKKSEEYIPSLLGETYRLLAALSREIQKEQNPDLLLRAQNLLESGLDRKIRIDQIAGKLGVSSAALNRLFQTRLHLSPMRYRLEYRLARANYLLKNTSLSVKEIAYQLGYCNQFYFSQEYRRIHNCTPMETRKKDRS